MLTSHLARFQLERLAADHPQSRIAPAARVHVSACDLCRMRLRALVAARDRFLNAQPALVFARDVVTRAERLGPQQKSPWWVAPPFVRAALGMLALSAAVLTWFAHDAAATWSRASAGASFHVLAKRGSHERRVRDGDTLAKGDRLAFEYALQRPTHFMLLGVDDTGTIRRYVPADGATATDLVLEATPRSRLPAGIELGPQHGNERLCALFSSQPIAEVAARQAIAGAVGAAWANGDGLSKTPQTTLSVQWISVWFRKRADDKAPNAATEQRELTLR